LLQFNKNSADFINTMWCKHCQQDVPALTNSTDRKFCCPRCGVDLAGQDAVADKAKPKAAAEAQPDFVSVDDASPCDNWELDDELRQIGQALQIDKKQAKNSQKVYKRELIRLDHAHTALNHRHHNLKTNTKRKKIEKSMESKGGSVFSAFIWLALSIGTTALVCGGVLLGWSRLTGRGELWNIGLPTAVGGQIALVVGLVLQLDRFRHESRRTVSKLNEVGDNLDELKTTTELLNSVHGPSSTSFYTHLAGGASPQLLLNDLKGQLDLLALKMGEEE
jgi:hypothetical protein